MKLLLYLAIGSILFSPSLISAASLCSKDGYTLATINGVFTDEVGAEKNMDRLSKIFGPTYSGETIDYKLLLNQTHSVLDITDTAIQKTFEGMTRKTSDFIKIQQDASAQVKTQKLLLVAHSQGNFYANDLYDTVTENGDVSPKSIGVYSVGTPANNVAGNGKYLTSSTDNIIAHLVENLLIGRIMTPNTTIDYKLSDDNGLGHGFSDVYLKYRSAEIIRDIKWSLDKLSVDSARSENTICITPPKLLTTLQKVVAVPLYAVDTTIAIGTVAVATTKNTAVGAFRLAVNGVVWTYHTTAAAVVWTYDASVMTSKLVAQATYAASSAVYDVIAKALSSGGLISNNSSATVILATEMQPNDIGLTDKKVPIIVLPKIVAPVGHPTKQAQAAGLVAFVAVPVDPAPATGKVVVPDVSVPNPKLSDTPRLIFVGAQSLSSGFGGGGGGQSLPAEVVKVLAFVDETVLAPPVEQSSSEVEASASKTPIAPNAPSINVSQCAFSLATDGCLLATTSIHFEWAPVVGADYYAISKNGIFATTTETTIDAVAKDFSDYTLGVATVSVSEAGGLVTTSATSTKTVSVATIPVAINEVAWAGTLASATDEWLELKNNTAHAIDLSNWALETGDKKLYVKLTGIIAPRAYIIFERTDDGVVKDVLAQGVYTGILKNTGEELFLSHASSTLDKTPVILGKWAGGESISTTTKKTMERYISKESGANVSNWGTNLDFMQNGTDAKGNAIEGTPGARNSVSYLINKGRDITEDTTLRADEGPYIIRDSEEVRVHASSTLTIEAGNKISFQEGDWAVLRDGAWRRKSLFIEGRLVVEGTSEKPVLFSSDSSDNEEGGVFEFFGGTGTSTINYANIEGIQGISLDRGARVEILNSVITGTEYGVILLNGSNILLENDRIASTTEDVILLSLSTGTVASTTIEHVMRGEAIRVYNNSSLSLASTTIRDVLEGYGIEVDNSYVVMASSTIIGVFSGKGINAKNAHVSITSSEIKNIFGGAGVNLYQSSFDMSSSTISGVVDDSGVSAHGSTLSITSSTIENIEEGKGISATSSFVLVASSTIRNISGGGSPVVSNGDGISVAFSTSTINNVTLENGAGNGIHVFGGNTVVSDGSVSGFAKAGVLVEVGRALQSTEVTENGVTSTVPIETFSGTATISNVVIHDNGVNDVILPEIPPSRILSN